MASSVERLLQRYQDNRESVAKWAAMIAIAWSGVVLVMSLVIPEIMTASGSTFSPQLILTGVKLSMPPVLIAGVAWGTARTVRARKTGLLTMGAVWFCVLVVFVSQVQYYRLVSGAGIVKSSTQTEQSQ